jgi:hypothetical protein
VAKKNPRPGDSVVLNVPWKMTGYGKVPLWDEDRFFFPMVVLKRCKSGLYQCAVHGRRQTVSISKERLDIV